MFGTAKAFFFRNKENLQYIAIQEKQMANILHQHIMKDEIVELKNESSKTKFTNKLRRAAVWDEENQHVIELITNQFNWSLNTISELYNKPMAG
ncbi:MAG: hypothetical protein ACJA0U_001981 [Salibacteraceae bacterium]|jgi:hypothetical protein